jgi:O-antigen/teichoic acid export membrane protein
LGQDLPETFPNMASSNTEKVLALSSGRALTTVVSLIAAAVLSRVLSKHDYATYRQTLLAFAFASPFLTLGLPRAINFFMPGEQSRKRGVLLDNILLLTLTGATLTSFLLFGGNRLLAWRFNNPELAYTLKVFAPYSLFMLPVGVLGGCLVVQDRITWLSVFNVLSRLLTVSVVIVTCLLWRNPVAPIVSQVITGSLVCGVALILMTMAVPNDSWRPSFASMKAMVKYSVPLGLAGMAGTTSMQMDKLIVSSMCSPEEFAVYGNGAIEIPLIGVITGSICAVIVPDMTRLYKEDNRSAAIALFNRAAVKSASFLLPIMGLFLIFAKVFIVLLFSSKYIDSVIPFRLYLLIIPARVVYFGAALQATGNSKVILYGAILDLCFNTVLSILLVQLIGYNGAIISTVISTYLLNFGFLSFFISKKYDVGFRVVFPVRDIMRIALVCLVATIPTIPYLYFRATKGNSALIVLSGIAYSGVCVFLLCRMQLVPNPVLWARQRWKRVR